MMLADVASLRGPILSKSPRLDLTLTLIWAGGIVRANDLRETTGQRSVGWLVYTMC